jgi:hypothetical protein
MGLNRLPSIENTRNIRIIKLTTSSSDDSESRWMQLNRSDGQGATELKLNVKSE